MPVCRVLCRLSMRAERGGGRTTVLVIIQDTPVPGGRS